MKYKYFTRWKLFSNDYSNKLKFAKRNKYIKKRTNTLKFLIEKIKDKNEKIILRKKLRKWRKLVFAEKMAMKKALEMYEKLKKITEDNINEFSKGICNFNEEEENFINSIPIKYDKDDESKFIQKMKELYIIKNNNLKLKYNINKESSK